MLVSSKHGMQPMVLFDMIKMEVGDKGEGNKWETEINGFVSSKNSLHHDY